MRRRYRSAGSFIFGLPAPRVLFFLVLCALSSTPGMGTSSISSSSLAPSGPIPCRLAMERPPFPAPTFDFFTTTFSARHGMVCKLTTSRAPSPQARAKATKRRAETSREPSCWRAFFMTLLTDRRRSFPNSSVSSASKGSNSSLALPLPLPFLSCFGRANTPPIKSDESSRGRRSITSCVSSHVRVRRPREGSEMSKKDCDHQDARLCRASRKRRDRCARSGKRLGGITKLA